MKNSNKFWDKQAKNYNSGASKETMDLLNKSEKYLKDTYVVLDFACGTGDSTIGIAKHVDEIVGIDMSKEMIKYAKLRVEEAELTNVKLIATTLDDSELISGSFDIIFAFNIIHLLDDWGSTMERVNHLLKPSGLFISNTACMGEKANFTSHIIKLISKLSILPNIKSYTCNELEESISSYGFSTLESIKSDEKVPNLYLVAKKMILL